MSRACHSKGVFDFRNVTNLLCLLRKTRVAPKTDTARRRERTSARRHHFMRDFLRKRKMEGPLCCNGPRKKRARMRPPWIHTRPKHVILYACTYRENPECEHSLVKMCRVPTRNSGARGFDSWSWNIKMSRVARRKTACKKVPRLVQCAMFHDSFI